jgi:flagellar hook-basal body complex protein FliE
MPIGLVSAALPLIGPGATPSLSGDSDASGLGSAFSTMLNAVQASGAEANTKVSGMLDGTTDVHDAMIALQQADITLQLSVQIRNKLVSAYQEIMRMPV